LSSTAIIDQYPIVNFDEFRTNLQDAMGKADGLIKTLKKKDKEGDTVAKLFSYLYQGLFAIINAEKKYRAGDYAGAVVEFEEGGRNITRFQRMSTGFSIDYQQIAERLDLYNKGRQYECQALKKGVTVENQIANLLEAINSYTLESQIVLKFKNPLLQYNAQARMNFVLGLVNRLEGQQAVVAKDFRLAKEKHLAAYRAFYKASYFNPSYSMWVKEQNKTINTTINLLVKDRASKAWGLAYSLSNEGKFLESSEQCLIASKFYKRASKLTSEKKESIIMNAFSFMLRASMFEAKANEFLKNENDAKKAVTHFELAAEAMQQAITILRKDKSQEKLVKRWDGQRKYYSGNFQQSHGIFHLDNEQYKEALGFFETALSEFEEALQDAIEIKETGLAKLLKKSIAEAKGFIGMCNTVLD